MIEDEFGNWVIKNTPKTSSGYRNIEFPSFIIERLSTHTGKIIHNFKILNHFELMQHKKENP